MGAKTQAERIYRVTNLYPEVTPEEHAERMRETANRLYAILRPYSKAPQKEPGGKEKQTAAAP